MLYINGRRGGDEYFPPSNSLFHTRNIPDLIYPISDTFTYRCYYSTYDISEWLKPGINTLEIALGSGWYRQKERTCEGTMCFGESLGAIYALTAEDAADVVCICSDGSEQCRSSSIVESQLFRGEVVDARIKKFELSAAAVCELPDTILMPEDSPPNRIIGHITLHIRDLTQKRCRANAASLLYGSTFFQ